MLILTQPLFMKQLPQSSWNLAQYEKFKKERSQPFWDLLALIPPHPKRRILDLGCGSGELTQQAHQRLEARETLGIDSSDTMLEKSHSFKNSSLHFMQGDINILDEENPFGLKIQGPFDLILSNAALQWVPEHERIFLFLRNLLSEKGEIAIQVPSNYYHPSHRIAFEMAETSPFKEALNGYRPPQSVLAPEAYAQLLYHLGFQEQLVRQQVYPHFLASREDIVEWIKGTWLTAYKERLPEKLYDLLLANYQKALFAELPEQGPIFYPFKRTFLWARR
ncbi:MAG TPA: methyltransferase domain-containing protein [Chthoniobacterales bacterium]|nr:methyltransferase domain-containing protein [Chthoniobacterales bacterium]